MTKAHFIWNIIYADSCHVSDALDDLHILQRPLKTHTINKSRPSSFKAFHQSVNLVLPHTVINTINCISSIHITSIHTMWPQENRFKIHTVVCCLWHWTTFTFVVYTYLNWTNYIFRSKRATRLTDDFRYKVTSDYSSTVWTYIMKWLWKILQFPPKKDKICELSFLYSMYLLSPFTLFQIMLRVMTNEV